jgi:hypothetical protein
VSGTARLKESDGHAASADSLFCAVGAVGCVLACASPVDVCAFRFETQVRVRVARSNTWTLQSLAGHAQATNNRQIHFPRQ